MESFEEPGLISKENLLEVPPLNDSLSEDEDVKSTLEARFSPSPRRRNSDSSEETDPEAPSTIARKVSFADAFGFDLVSVKEFDTWEVPTTLPNDDLEDEVVPVEEFYLTPLFTLPTTQEELLQKVRAQKVWLESIEFQPGITCMKGIIRVLNVSFEKLVYVRMSLDNWLTYYDILAEYVPNSCDGETDQFLFKISLVPPYQRDGAKIDFCIRYETSVGIFWANYNHHNYILICHKKETAPVEDTKPQEDTDKHIKSCLKSTLNSKEEILATADEDIWNNSRASESNIPKIRCLDVDDNEIKQSKENVKGKNVEDNEEDNEDNEKELELLLRHHFTRTRGSSRDENNANISEPVKFPNDQQDLGEKVSSGLVRQPMPISCLTEHVLQERELQNIQKFSTGYEYSQLLPEKHSTVESVNNSAQFLESSITSETPLSQEFWPGTKEKEAAYSTDVIASKQVMNHTDVPKDETVSAPGSKTIERLFISEDNYDQHQEVWEGRLEMIPLNHSEQIQLKENILGGQGDNMKPVHEQLVQKTSPQTSESSLKNIVIKEPVKETFENRTQPHLRRTYDNTLADVDIAITSSENAHSKDDDVEEKYKTEYNIDMGKEIKLSILEHPSEEEQMYPLTTKPADTKYLAEIQNQSWLSTTDSYEFGLADELSQGEVVRPSRELSEVHAEAVYESTGFSWLNGNESSVRTKKGQGSSTVSKDFNRMNNQLSKDTNIIQFCPSNPNFVTTTDKEISIHSPSINQEDVFDAGGNVEKAKYCQNYDPENISILEAEPCQNERDRVVTDDQGNRAGQGNCWSVLESQFAERESEANKRVQMKEQTGGEAMWGIRDNTRCLNVTPTDELFTCQDPVIYEGSSVAEYDSTGEAEAGTAAYVIKMTSESTPEKMSAGEKAVIVKLPQETALSDRPTEEKETVFDIHEGRNDGSHYPLCQCNTVGVLYDTKFEKESVSDIYNAHTHETAQEEIVSVPNASKKLAREEYNSGNDLPFSEILWTYAAEGKPIRKQELSSEPSLNTSLYPQPGLHNEQAEEERVWGTFPDIGTKTEHNISLSDMNTVASSHENASTPVSEESMEINTAERGNAPHPYIESSINVSARLGCVFSPTNVVTDFSSNVSSEIELGDLPQSSALLLSGEEGAWNVGEFVHKPEHKLGKFLGPTILISEPTEEKEETNSESEGINEERVLNLNNEGCDNQPVFDHTEIPGQQNEACSLAAECLILKQIGFKILYFLLFLVFCVTLYHYDLIVCFAMYLFSLYWLYCEGRRSKESVKKE